MSTKNWFFSFKPFLSSVIIYILGVVLFTIWTSYEERSRIHEEIHLQLLRSAENIKNILPADFHDRALTPDAISNEENRAYTELLSKCARTAGVKYLYTAVVRNGKVYFTSSSASEKDTRENNLPTYWQAYPESTDIFVNALKKKTTSL